MITGLFFMTAKPEQVDAFQALMTEIVTTTRTEDEGCIAFVLHQQHDDQHAFMLYEQWHDQAALDAHFARLERIFGIARIRDFLVETRTVLYDVVA